MDSLTLEYTCILIRSYKETQVPPLSVLSKDSSVSSLTLPTQAFPEERLSSLCVDYKGKQTELIFSHNTHTLLAVLVLIDNIMSQRGRLIKL